MSDDVVWAPMAGVGEVSPGAIQNNVFLTPFAPPMSSATTHDGDTNATTPGASASSSDGHLDFSKWRDARHVVAAGDSLSLIAEIYQSPVQLIQAMNDLHPDSVIYPGDTLSVPTPLRLETHVVRAGETLTEISKTFDTPLAHVKRLNAGITSGNIHPGTKLVVLRGTNSLIQTNESRHTRVNPDVTSDVRVTKEVEVRAEKAAVVPASPQRLPTAHVSHLRNNDRNNDHQKQSPRRRKAKACDFITPMLRLCLFPVSLVNRVIDVSIGCARGAATPLTAFRLVRLPAGEPKSTAQRLLAKKNRVVTKSGDSLASIASGAGVSIRELQRINGITNDAVDAGHVIRVTRLAAHERAPRLRRRTKRHLFERPSEEHENETSDGNGNSSTCVVHADRRWRSRSWRYEPRGGDAVELFSRRTGVGRGDVLNGEPVLAATFGDGASNTCVTGKPHAVNEAMQKGKCGAKRSLWWEHVRPTRSNNRWHPDFCAPVAVWRDAFVTSGFGFRWGRLHAGVDLSANEGTPVRAASNGVVKQRVFDEHGYGWLLRLTHEDGWETRYAHCVSVDVSEGQRIKKGQSVAKVGNTGRSFGPHLHFETRRFGVPLDPLTCSKA